MASLIQCLKAMTATGRGAQMGILIKNAEALERLESVDVLIVDKTGTLTEGKAVWQPVTMNGPPMRLNIEEIRADLQCRGCADRRWCAIPVFWYPDRTHYCRLCDECFFVVCGAQCIAVASGEYLNICSTTDTVTLTFKIQRHVRPNR